MIIYWETLEHNAGDTMRLPDYVVSEYIGSVHFSRNIYWENQIKNSGKPEKIPDYILSDFCSGVSRIYAVNNYPASPPYGAIRYRTDLKKYLGFKEDSGWSDLGGAAFNVLESQVFS